MTKLPHELKRIRLNFAPQLRESPLNTARLIAFSYGFQYAASAFVRHFRIRTKSASPPQSALRSCQTSPGRR